MELLRAEGICKAFREPVLTGACLSVLPGECVGLVGRNGCGKSTLLSILAGGLRADAGSLYLGGGDAFSDRRLFGNIGYAPQSDPIIPELTVRDNLALWYAAAKRPMKHDMHPDGRLARMGLIPIMDKRAGTLSGGMKRRVNIAGALASGARLLILDEPSGGLDVVARQEIEFHMKEYMNMGGAIIMATHDKAEIDLCTRVMLLKNGVLSQVRTGISAGELAYLIISDR